MDVNIIEQKENPLLDRTEVLAELIFEKESTPSRDAITSRVSALLNSDQKRTILKEIQTKFGETKAIAKLRVYKSEEIARRVEPDYVLKRNNLTGEVKNE